MTHDNAVVPVPDDEAATDAAEAERMDEGLEGLTDEQDKQAQRYAIAFLKKIIRLRGVRIERAAFLRQELRKAGVSDEVIARAVETTPVQAGVSLAQLDDLASASIAFETRKSAAMSFASGLPGGLAIVATVPADVTQYYVHAFRVMQKLACLYGWQDLLGAWTRPTMRLSAGCPCSSGS